MTPIFFLYMLFRNRGALIESQSIDINIFLELCVFMINRLVTQPKRFCFNMDIFEPAIVVIVHYLHYIWDLVRNNLKLSKEATLLCKIKTYGKGI